MPDPDSRSEEQSGKKVFVILRAEETGDPERTGFLTKVLEAVQVNLETEAWVGSTGVQNPGTKPLLVFGLTPSQLGYTFQAPLYQPFRMGDRQFLFSDSLRDISADKNKKAALWKALQILFIA